MAYDLNLENNKKEIGAVLIPVLLFASMVALASLILLQTQLVQKKAIGEFRYYVKNTKTRQEQIGYWKSQSVEKLLQINSLKLIQQLPSNLHAYNTTDYYYYFQIKSNSEYVHKLKSPPQSLSSLSENTYFNYADKKINIIESIEDNKPVLYFYNIENSRILSKSIFEQQPFFQLVGNPVDCLYIQDGRKLYKSDLTCFPVIELQLLSVFETVELVLARPPIITRDARGDGRLVKIATTGLPIVYHESSKIENACLDLFEHEDFS